MLECALRGLYYTVCKVARKQPDSKVRPLCRAPMSCNAHSASQDQHQSSLVPKPLLINYIFNYLTKAAMTAFPQMQKAPEHSEAVLLC